MLALEWRAFFLTALTVSSQMLSEIAVEGTPDAQMGSTDDVLAGHPSDDFLTAPSPSVVYIESSSEHDFPGAEDAAAAAPFPGFDSPEDAEEQESVQSARRRRRGGGYHPSYSSRRRSSPSYSSRRRSSPSYEVRRRYSPSPSYDRRRYSPSYNDRRRYVDQRRRFYYDSGRRRFGGHYVWQRRRRQYMYSSQLGVNEFAFFAITSIRRRRMMWVYSGGGGCTMRPAYTTQSGGVPAANVPAIQQKCTQSFIGSADAQTACFQCDGCMTNACISALPGCAAFTQQLYLTCPDPNYGRDPFQSWLSSVLLICCMVCCPVCIIWAIVRAVKRANEPARDVQMSLISDQGPGPNPYTSQRSSQFDDGFGHISPGTSMPEITANEPTIEINQPHPVYADQGAPSMPPAGQMETTGPQQFTVQVPPGVGPGEMVQVLAPTGQTVQVRVPEGVVAGQQFAAQL